MGNRQSDISQRDEQKHVHNINRSDFLYMFGANQDGHGEIIVFDSCREQFCFQNTPLGMKIFDYMGVIKVSNNLIYLSGGINKQKNHISDELIEYNPITNSYSYLSSMKNSRYTHCLTFKNGKLYAIGGRTYGEGINGLLASCEVYDFSNRNWKEISPLSEPRCTFFTFQYNDEIYVCGGFNGNKKRTELIEKYNESQNCWETIEMKLNKGIECGNLHILEQSKDEFVIFGGNCKEGPTNECWRYNLKKQTYELIGKMQAKRVLSKSILTSKGQIYILGGDRELSNNIQNFQNSFQQQKKEELENIQNDFLNQFNNEIKREENILQKILKQVENNEGQGCFYKDQKKEQHVIRMKADLEQSKSLQVNNINNNQNHIQDKQTVEKTSFLSYGLKFERIYSLESDQIFKKRSYQNWKNYSQASEIQIVKCSVNELLSIQNQDNLKRKRNNSFGEQANNILKNFISPNKQDQEKSPNNISIEEVNILQQHIRNSHSMDIEEEQYGNLIQDEYNQARQFRAVSIALNNDAENLQLQFDQNINKACNLPREKRFQSVQYARENLRAQIDNEEQINHYQNEQHQISGNQNINNPNNHQVPFSRRFYIFGISENQDFIAEIDILNQNLLKKKRPKKLKLLSYRSGVRFEESESIFICGGVNDEMTKISSSVYMYYPNEDRVDILKPMNSRRYTFCCVKKGNYIYALGGRSYGNDDAAIMSKCERYNIATKEWEVIASMKYKRCSFMASCVENKLYVAGGYGGSMVRHSTFECYHEAEDRWELMGIELIEPIEASTLLNIASHDNKIILILGGRSTKDDSDKVYCYDIKHGFDAFQGNLCGTLSSKRCLHKQIPLNHDSTTFLLLGGFTKGERVSAYSFNAQTNQLQNQSKEFQNLINKLDSFLFKDLLQNKDYTLRRNLLL
ncbi:kelch motif protein (macronuclear) [Tetrahymena thermophila SB210]|uniref:Kelch motif protein n=1 Tax=Tetrahymena thermophila (strain SB210) TaxID=312017 RepID=I7M7D5_TETTS|nr:kelch motif protein [Tetrahymena thermophila SB210]EAR91022.2 kelch motif protein [Tetrahymena thermophila SB210]|eukprot:XP_001011267.2 kelch motif protein [Tetrahymena thermophila SB210]